MDYWKYVNSYISFYFISKWRSQILLAHLDPRLNIMHTETVLVSRKWYVP